MNYTLDLTQYETFASQTCMNSAGYMTDNCLYKILCKPMGDYFRNYNIGFLIIGIIVIIVGLIVNRNIKDKILSLNIERDILFYYISACIMYFIINIYFNYSS